MPSSFPRPRPDGSSRGGAATPSPSTTDHPVALNAAVVVDQAPYGLAVVASSGRILHANPAFGQILATTGDPSGLLLQSLLPGHESSVAGQLRRAQEGGGVVEDTLSLRRTGEPDLEVALAVRRVAPALHPAGSDPLFVVNIATSESRRDYLDHLALVADHDPLTGLHNRRWFDLELRRILRQPRDDASVGALLFLDLDHFHEVNETVGHDAGDQLLATVARALARELSPADRLARLGGDEFAILAPGANREAGADLAERLIRRVRDASASVLVAGRSTTASVGVVILDPDDERQGDPLALADMLLRDAKLAGRDQAVLLSADQGSSSVTGARLVWRNRVERALRDDLFEVHLQPIVDLRDGAVVGAEALLRLADADELVPPGRFVYIAEQTGLAPQMDEWVIRHALPMLARLREISRSSSSPSTCPGTRSPIRSSRTPCSRPSIGWAWSRPPSSWR